MDVKHEGQRTVKIAERNQAESPSQIEGMENSDQTGYGTTENYQLVAVQCKKCDETLDNNHLLRIHMRKHVRKESEILKCISCEYESKNENEYLNHIVDNHSTVHICQTCDNRFTAKNELLAHMGTVHGLNPNKASEPFHEDVRNTIKCFSCGTMLDSKESLMKHKREQHWKEKKCAFFHGVGNGCRFPGNICFNIHRMEEQEFRRQPQGAGGQGQGAGGQGQGAGGQGQGAGGQGQGAGGRGQQASGQANNSVHHSWAGVARGHGVWGQDQDGRKNIDCRDGNHCRYYSQGECRYRHNNKSTKTVNINPHNPTIVMKNKPVNQVSIWKK